MLNASTTDMVTTAATSAGVPSSLALGIASQSNGDVNYVNPITGGVGIMSLTPTAIDVYQVSNPNDAQSNINAGVAYLSSLLSTYNGNQTQATAAYGVGMNNVPASQSGAGTTNPLLAQYVNAISNAVGSEFTSTVKPSTELSGDPVIEPVKPSNTLPVSYLPAPSPAQVSPPWDQGMLADSNGIDNPSWVDLINPPYSCFPHMFVGNKDKALDTAKNTPVSFTVIMPYSAMPLVSGSSPMTVRLNTSLSSYSISTGHVVVKNPTLTGMHVTVWDQRPDLISGEGVTGVFMNYYGLTSLMSMASAPDEMQAKIKQVFNPKAAWNDQNLRVAAQDAFAELLLLFKMNGVWFFTQNTDLDQLDGTDNAKSRSTVTTWSPAAGSNTTQINARRNDVLARGYISLNLRGSSYLGYFKEFVWTMDADQPFMWKFNFVFQEEKTIRNVVYPSIQGAAKQSSSVTVSQVIGNPSDSNSGH